MKLIIAGTRTFNNFDLLSNELHNICIKHQITEIVSGCAKGADRLGELWAHTQGIKIKQFHANWQLYGKLAGPKRNKQMSEYADALIAFWDGKSSGTKNMIELAKKLKLQITIIYYERQ